MFAKAMTPCLGAATYLTARMVCFAVKPRWKPTSVVDFSKDKPDFQAQVGV